jgi:DNA-binding transcriptional MocR family regulator
MKKHAAILAPKFAAVQEILAKELGPAGLAEWTNPRGGYFVSLDVPEGCAKRVVSLCKEAGLAVTPAGASFPYGEDPRNRNIRIAPTFPPLSELRTALTLLCLCVKIAGAEKLLAARS